MNFGRGVLRLRLGIEDGGRAFAQGGIDGVCNASLDGHDRRGQAIQSAGEVVFRLERVGEQVVVL